MTADNLPLLGAVEDLTGLWIAEALWVTHAAGATQALAHLMTDDPRLINGIEALRPNRFADQRPGELTARALGMSSTFTPLPNPR